MIPKKIKGYDSNDCWDYVHKRFFPTSKLKRRGFILQHVIKGRKVKESIGLTLILTLKCP